MSLLPFDSAPEAPAGPDCRSTFATLGGAPAAPAKPAGPPAVRTFYRCADCLSVLAVDGLERPHTCGACTGRLERMGVVHRQRLTRTEHRCPCDHRCTGARGPECECACGGENHGRGLLVRVRVDLGPVPVATPRDPGKAKATAEAYREALRRAQLAVATRHKATTEAKAARGYVSSEAYWSWQDDTRRLADARGLRTHAGRLAALARIEKGGR